MLTGKCFMDILADRNRKMFVKVALTDSFCNGGGNNDTHQGSCVYLPVTNEIFTCLFNDL